MRPITAADDQNYSSLADLVKKSKLRGGRTSSIGCYNILHCIFIEKSSSIFRTNGSRSMKKLMGSVFFGGSPHQVAGEIVFRHSIEVSRFMIRRRGRPIKGPAHRPIDLPIDSTIRIETQVYLTPAIRLRFQPKYSAKVGSLHRSSMPTRH